MTEEQAKVEDQPTTRIVRERDSALFMNFRSFAQLTKSTVSWVLKYPKVTLSILITYVAITSVYYNTVYFKKFGIDVLEYYTLLDFLLSGIRNPLVLSLPFLVLFLISVFLFYIIMIVSGFIKLLSKAVLHSSLIQFKISPGFRKFTYLYFVLFLIAGTLYMIAVQARFEYQAVRLSLDTSKYLILQDPQSYFEYIKEESGLNTLKIFYSNEALIEYLERYYGKANPLTITFEASDEDKIISDCRIIGATENYMFFFNNADNTSFVVPADRIIQIVAENVLEDRS